MKRVAAVHGSPEGHWVGDGFPVRSLFSYHYARRRVEPVPAARPCRPCRIRARRAAARCGRASAPRVRDRDDRLSGRGRASRLGGQRRSHRPRRRAVDDGGRRADARGIPLAGVHASAAARWKWRSCGSTCRRRTRWRRPRYQAIVAAQIPVVELPGGAGRVRVIAGEFGGVARAGDDVHARQRLGRPAAARPDALTLAVPDGHTTLIALLRGSVNGQRHARGHRSRHRAIRPRRRSTCASRRRTMRRSSCSPASRSTSRSPAMGRS